MKIKSSVTCWCIAYLGPKDLHEIKKIIFNS